MKKLMFTLCTLVIIYAVYKTYQIYNLDKGLHAIKASGAVVLDVRTKFEYDQEHIPGSINIPLSQLHKGGIPVDTGMQIITCCSHGLRSVKAVSVLKKRGYRRVYNGGAWVDLQKTLNDE